MEFKCEQISVVNPAFNQIQAYEVVEENAGLKFCINSNESQKYAALKYDKHYISNLRTKVQEGFELHQNLGDFIR